MTLEFDMNGISFVTPEYTIIQKQEEEEERENYLIIKETLAMPLARSCIGHIIVCRLMLKLFKKMIKK